MSKHKLVPVEPTSEMIDAWRTARTHPRERYKAMLAAAPEVEKVGFCEDTALSLAERTFSTEVDEQLAEDIIQYARRLHSRYTAPQPAPEVTKLVEALELFMNSPTPTGEDFDKARAAIADYRKQGGDL